MPGKKVMLKCLACGFDNSKKGYNRCPGCKANLVVKKSKSKGKNGHRVPPRTRTYR